MLAALVAALVLALGATAHADEAAPYPVRFLPTLPVQSVDEIEAELSAPFDFPAKFPRQESKSDPEFAEPWLDADTAHHEDGYGRIRYRKVANCREVFSAWSAGFTFGIGGTEGPANEATFVECQQLQFLKTARPSARSYFQAFRLDENTPRVLPAVVPNTKWGDYPDSEAMREDPSLASTWTVHEKAVNCEWYEGIDGERLMTPCLPDQPFEIRARSPYQASYLLPPDFGTPGEIQDLEWFDPAYDVFALKLLAFADFDGDGNEDVLLGMDNATEYATQGVYAIDNIRGKGLDPIFSVWLLTRLSSDGPLTVIRRLSICCGGDPW